MLASIATGTVARDFEVVTVVANCEQPRAAMEKFVDWSSEPQYQAYAVIIVCTLYPTLTVLMVPASILTIGGLGLNFLAVLFMHSF